MVNFCFEACVWSWGKHLCMLTSGFRQTFLLNWNFLKLWVWLSSTQVFCGPNPLSVDCQWYQPLLYTLRKFAGISALWECWKFSCCVLHIRAIMAAFLWS
jgi:hypothetical protein